MECRERMERYLQENNVPFEVMTHDRAYTMQEAAAALHVSGKRVAKVVMVKGDGQIVMFAIPASHRLNLDNVRAALDVKVASLASEKEFSALFPDCEPGAMPPFGNLYDVPVHIDRALAGQESIVFRIGTHRHTMRIAYADFARLAQPTVGDYTYLV